MFTSLSPFTKIVLLYTGIRIGLFVAVAAVLFALGFNDIVLVAVALVASGVLSYPLARKQRAELALQYEARRRTRSHLEP